MLMEQIEVTILRNLIHNEDYARKVVPFLQPEYFEDNIKKTIFLETSEFLVRYDSLITLEALEIEISNRSDLNGQDLQEVKKQIADLEDKSVDEKWLVCTHGINSYCRWQ
jgi:hypothetical protein